MDDIDDVGSLVLEQLAAIGQDHAFLDAVDADDVAEARRLMRTAGVSGDVADRVVRAMAEAG